MTWHATEVDFIYVFVSAVPATVILCIMAGSRQSPAAIVQRTLCRHLARRIAAVCRRVAKSEEGLPMLWVPCQCSIPGIERADSLEAAARSQNTAHHN